MENIIKFEDIKEQLLAALEANDKCTHSESVSLFDGFIEVYMRDDMGPPLFGGCRIPTIALVGEDTGQLYLYAVKAILPDLDI